MSGVTGRILGSHSPQEPVSIYRRNVENVARDSDQTRAKKLANQLCYNRASESGSFFGYSGYGYGGLKTEFNTSIGWKQYTQPIYVMSVSQPRRRVYLVVEEETGEVGEKVLGAEETLRTGASNIAIMEENLHVPLPSLNSLPHGDIASAGTDGQAYIWCPATDECWQFHRLSRFKEGPLKGEWKAGAMHYQSSVSTWNGVCPLGKGQVSASKMSIGGGNITHSDLLQVARGGKIEHALGMAILVTKNEHILPALANDTKTNPFSKMEDGTTTNPAFGEVDAVPEGTWCAFPKTSHPSEFGITRKLSVALFECFREYGYYVHDGGGNCQFQVADPRTLFTPYSEVAINPFAGASHAQFDSYINENVSEEVRKNWIDTSLPDPFEGNLTGVGGAIVGFPWRIAEALIPREA